MTTPQYRAQLLRTIIENFPGVRLAYLQEHTDPPTIVVHASDAARHAVRLLDTKEINVTFANPPTNTFTTLLARTDAHRPLNLCQACQNEPVKLGTQIQPAKADWLGTAGCPASWSDQSGRRVWGFATNWHVASGGSFTLDHPQHQPTTKFPPLGYTSILLPPKPDRSNLYDCAFIDAKHNGLHTIDWSVLHLNKLGHDIQVPAVGQSVIKVGRTTCLTRGTIIATDAAARVQYGPRTYAFTNLFVVAGQPNPFSAPGDSGSAVWTHPATEPLGQLFAGNDELTLAIPWHLLPSSLKLSFTP